MKYGQYVYCNNFANPICIFLCKRPDKKTVVVENDKRLFEIKSYEVMTLEAMEAYYKPKIEKIRNYLNSTIQERKEQYELLLQLRKDAAKARIACNKAYEQLEAVKVANKLANEEGKDINEYQRELIAKTEASRSMQRHEDEAVRNINYLDQEIHKFEINLDNLEEEYERVKESLYENR